VRTRSPRLLPRRHLDLALELEELAAGEGHDAVARLNLLPPVFDGAARGFQGAEPLVAADFDRVVRVCRQLLDEL
jgi:hypothetical protein